MSCGSNIDNWDYQHHCVHKIYLLFPQNVTIVFPRQQGDCYGLKKQFHVENTHSILHKCSTRIKWRRRLSQLCNDNKEYQPQSRRFNVLFGNKLHFTFRGGIRGSIVCFHSSSPSILVVQWCSEKCCKILGVFLIRYQSLICLIIYFCL